MQNERARVKMDNETLRKVQLAQLEIGKEIKRVCDENGIKYFLDSGTLLGAIRHKGFIPWDDDMDMGMLREDYERFIEIAPKKLKPEYFLQTWKTDKSYPYAFAKIRKKGTVFIEAVSQKTNAHNEIFVDIFPYDVYPDDETVRTKLTKKIMLLKYSLWMKDGMTPWLRHKSALDRLLVRAKYVPHYFYALTHSRNAMIAEYEKLMPMHNAETSKYYVEQSGGTPFGKWIIPTECFEKFIEVKFEDTMFLVPEKYDLYLKTVYGDYMQLPSVEKRGNWHQIVEVKV